MARRDLLTDSERPALSTVPTSREDLARNYMLSSGDLALIAERRGDANQIGFAVQLALMRHPGFGFTLEGGAPQQLVAFMAEQIDVSASAFDTYAARPATASVHVRQVGDALGLRGPTNADLPLLTEGGAKAAWSTDHGLPIVVGIIEALRTSGIALPSASVIERAGIAGRARARQHTYDALLASVPVESLPKLDATLVVQPKTSQAVAGRSCEGRRDPRALGREPTQWDAGRHLMMTDSPDTWAGVVAAVKLAGDNREAIGACRKSATRAKKPVRCAIEVKADQ